MYTLFLAVLLFSQGNNTTHDSNPFVGTWENYDISSFKDHYIIREDEFSDLSSIIVFNTDMSFIKTTNGIITKGKYEYKKNKLIFLESWKGEYVESYHIRWPKNTMDPYPKTPEIDFVYPELLTTTDREGNKIKVDLDVHYKKRD